MGLHCFGGGGARESSPASADGAGPGRSASSSSETTAAPGSASADAGDPEGTQGDDGGASTAFAVTDGVDPSSPATEGMDASSSCIGSGGGERRAGPQDRRPRFRLRFLASSALQNSQNQCEDLGNTNASGAARISSTCGNG